MGEFHGHGGHMRGHTRKQIVYLNAGGIAVAFSLATVLYGTGDGVPFDWLLSCVPMFALGLVSTGFGLHMAMQGAGEGASAEDSGKHADGRRQGMRYELLSLALFVIGVMGGLWRLLLAT